MQIDYIKLFDKHNIKYRHDKGWTHINCPFCKNPPDTHFNGGFSETSPAYNCWRCGKHSYIEALSLMFRVSPFEARKMLKGYTTGISFVEKKVAKGTNLELPGSTTLTPMEMKYLSDRKYNVPYLQKKFGIQGGGVFGDWSYRIIIPIFYEGKLVSWTGRSVLDRKTIDENRIPRYKNLDIEKSEINPKTIFFNLDNSRKDSVILVEGPFDVLRMGDDCICSLGTSVTSSQKELLRNKYKKIYIAFDNEPAAQDKARKLGMELDAIGLEVEVCNICADFNKNDPGELSAREVKIIKNELFPDG